MLCVMLELIDESSFMMFSIAVALVWCFRLPDAPDAMEETMDIGVDMTEPSLSSSSALCLLAHSIQADILDKSLIELASEPLYDKGTEKGV